MIASGNRALQAGQPAAGGYVAKKAINSNLVADLTWAELYTVKIRENLKILTPTVKKSPTSADLTENAALLRQQLESANRTVAGLSKKVGVEPHRSNRNRSDQ
jgi:hypothetical protein